MSIYINKQGSLKRINHIYHCTSKLLEGLDYEVHEWLNVVPTSLNGGYYYKGPSMHIGKALTFSCICCINSTFRSPREDCAIIAPYNNFIGDFVGISMKSLVVMRRESKGNAYGIKWGVKNERFSVSADITGITIDNVLIKPAYNKQYSQLDIYINHPYLSTFNVRLKNVVIDGINYYPVRLLHHITADSDNDGIARNAEDCGLINSKTGKFYGSISPENYGYFTVENEFIKSNLQALVPKASATSVKFDYTANQDITDFELIGYVDKYNYIACYQKGTEYLILSDDVIYAPEDCSDLFAFYSQLAVLQFNNFNTRAVRNMSQMIAATAIENIDVSMFSTPMVTNMYSMFSNNQKLKSINIDNFNTSKVSNFEGMFYQNLALTTAHVNINTANATNLKGFFYYCNHLKTIYSKDWNTNKVTQDTDMFNYCASLVGGNGTTYNASKIGKEMAVVDEVIETTVDEETVETVKEGYFTKPE